MLPSCHTYNVEAVKVESYVREDLGTNYLKDVTEFRDTAPKIPYIQDLPPSKLRPEFFILILKNIS